MGQGWLAGRITGLYREDFVNNAGTAAFSNASDVWREVQPAVTPANPGKGDSWLTRIRHFLQGVN